MGWREITWEAQDRLAGGVPLGLESWRAVMAAVAPVAEEDPAVTAVVGMAAASGSFRGAAPSATDPLVADVIEAATRGWDPEGGRAAVAAVTHLALRSAADERHEQVLAAAERELLVHQDPSPLSAALRAWRDQVAVTDVGPHEALTIAATQASLLRRAKSWIDQVDAPPGLELPELRAAVATAGEAWQLAVTSWSDVARREQVSPAGVTELSRRWAAVTAAMRAELSPARRVEALIDTGFGGCLQAGLSVRAPGETDTVLTQVGVSLEIAADPWHHARLHDHAPAHGGRPEPPAAAAPKADAPGRMSGQSRQWRGGVEIDPVENTHVNHVAAAQACRAGVIAQAALDGDPVATRVAAGASRGELEELAQRGRRARAQLIDLTRPMVAAALRRQLAFRSREAGRDLCAAVLTRVAEKIDSWDENRGRLSTWVNFMARHETQRVAARQEQPILQHEALMPSGVVDPHEWGRDRGLDVAEQVTTAWTLADLRRRVAELPQLQRTIVTARFGLATGVPESHAVIAERLGMHRQAVARVVQQALGELRDVQRHERDQSLPGLAARLREATPRDLAARLSAERQHRVVSNEKRPLIERIQERAEAARQQTQLGRWLSRQPDRAARDRGEGPER